MTESYKKVNYLLRLKKQIERKMIIETLQHLGNVPGINIKDYRYFGFGSVYFADFILFHKYLNINKLTSIDNKKHDEKRFRFNKPFDFIDFEICDCDIYLQNKLNWKDGLFMWLDYDDPLNESMIYSIELIASKAKIFDVFFITVESTAPVEGKEDEFIAKYNTYMSSHRKLKKSEKEFPQTLFDIFYNTIQSGISKRATNITFLPLFNLVYTDTTKMYTFGGIFCDDSNEGSIKDVLSHLKYIRNNIDLCEIDCPLLTPKEKMQIDSSINLKFINFPLALETGLKKEEIVKYRRNNYYKHYPQFFESVY